jgi:hypothetical protein
VCVGRGSSLEKGRDNDEKEKMLLRAMGEPTRGYTDKSFHIKVVCMASLRN